MADQSGHAETTSYAYDDAGQLIRMRAPDGASLAYGHDAAHRLTELKDDRGNAIKLVLDGMGNVTREEIVDASGTLVRQAQLAYDALNRLRKTYRDGADPGTRLEYDPAV